MQAKSSQPGCDNMICSFAKIYKQEGIGGLWRVRLVNQIILLFIEILFVVCKNYKRVISKYLMEADSIDQSIIFSQLLNLCFKKLEEKAPKQRYAKYSKTLVFTSNYIPKRKFLVLKKPFFLQLLQFNQAKPTLRSVGSLTVMFAST